MFSGLYEKQLKEVVVEYKKNHGKSKSMVHHLVNELASTQFDLAALAVEGTAKSEQLKRASANEELAIRLADQDNELGSHYESVLKLSEERTEESTKIATTFMDEYASDMQAILSLNAQLMLDLKLQSASSKPGSGSQGNSHPLEEVFKEKLDKLKSRVSLLMKANLDLGQRLIDSLVTEKALKKEIQDLKTQPTTPAEVETRREEKVSKSRRQYEQSLRAPETSTLCEKLIELHQKIDAAKQTLKSKQEEVEELEKRSEDLSKNISELMKYESQIGYDKLKDVGRQYKRVVRDYDELERRNKDLESFVTSLKIDQSRKQAMIEKTSKESKLLLFLNFKLVEEINQLSTDSASHKYSKEYFRRKKMLQEDEDVLLSLEEVYDSESNLRIQNAELVLEMAEFDTKLRRKDQEIQSRDAKLEALSRELEIYKNRNMVVEQQEEKKTGEFEDLLAAVNRSIVADENSRLRDDLRRLADMNNSLNLVIVDKDIKIASQGKIIQTLREEVSQIGLSFRNTTEELLKVRNIDLKRLATEKSQLEADLGVSNKLVVLLRDRVESILANVKIIRDLCSREDVRQVETVSPLIGRLLDEVKNFASGIQPPEQLAVEDILTKLWSQKEQVMVFKIDALSAYNGILENKCKGLEKALMEYFSKIEDLERERASLEANTALEKLKMFMANKEEEINSMTMRLEELISQQEDSKRSEKSQWNTLVKEVEAVGKDGLNKFQEIEKEMQAKVDAVIERCRTEVQNLSQRSDEVLADKEKELLSLRGRLEGVEFEGRAQMISQLEVILNQNLQLRKEVAQLEAANKIHEINVGAVEEINDASVKIIQSQMQDQSTKLEKANSDLKKQVANLKTELLENYQLFTTRASTLESKAAVYRDTFVRLLARLKDLPATDELAAVVADVERQAAEIAN